MDNAQSFYLNDVEVCPAKNQLAKGGQIVTIQPRVMGVLQYLARHHDRVVSTDELIDVLWDGRVVSYGTVPKSITSLRKALNELLPDEDVVANYSKKGYQLLLAPNYTRSTEQNTSFEHAGEDSKNSDVSVFRSKPVFMVAMFLSMALLAVFWFSNDSVPHNHKVEFEHSTGFTNEIGLERIAEPHPDGSHFAYVRDEYEEGAKDKFISTLVVRSGDGTEWVVDETDASWFKLAWSEDQTQLLAVEVKRSKGKPLTKDYFDIADYYYGIYVFKVDLPSKKVLNKALVAPWQGRLLSATWVNSSIIEVVARQGVQASNKRYRIDLSSQNNRTTELEVLPNTNEPLASSVFKSKQAVAYNYGKEIKVAIFDEKDSLITERMQEANIVNMSWIPDGSGVLLHFDYKRAMNLYLNGTTTDILLNRHKDRLNYNPRYSADGQKLYVTEKRFKEDIWKTHLTGERSNITENDTYNYLPIFSPDGEKVLYVSVRNDQIQIWLIENGSERKLLSTDADSISALMWNDGGSGFIYKADDKIFVSQMESGQQELILADAKNIRPLSWNEKDRMFKTVQYHDDQSNIWLVNTTDLTKKQLTFGAVGSAMAFDDQVYFQYKNKPGLWVVKNDLEPTLVSDEFPSNSKILAIQEHAIFYVSGGSCRESDVKQFDLQTEKISTVLARESSFTNSTSFHPLQGSLEIPCYIPESNIIEYR